MQQRMFVRPVGWNLDFPLIPRRGDVTQRRLQEKRHLEIVRRLPLLEEIRMFPPIAGPLGGHRWFFTKPLRGDLAGELEGVGKFLLVRRGGEAGILHIGCEFPPTC